MEMNEFVKSHTQADRLLTERQKATLAAMRGIISRNPRLVKMWQGIKDNEGVRAELKELFEYLKGNVEVIK